MYSVDIYSRVRRACLKDGITSAGPGLSRFMASPPFQLNPHSPSNLVFFHL
jgi:hypothetical protein